MHSPSFYYDYFKKNNVKHVVRLNNKRTYDAKRTFVEVANIQHSDMVFTDGTPPTDAILRGFLNLCERYIGDAAGPTADTHDGAVAVHCKGKSCFLLRCRFSNSRHAYVVVCSQPVWAERVAWWLRTS